MSFEHAIQDLAQMLYSTAPSFALVLCRVAGFMMFAPLLGSAKIPKRAKALLAISLAFFLSQGVSMPQNLPETTAQAVMGIGGELSFGLAIGMILSFTFIAAQWAGEMIGQQMGLNLSEVFDPQFGQAGSIIGDAYFMLTLVVFLSARGHLALIRGLKSSFTALPLMSVGLDKNLFDLLVGLFMSATTLAIQLAAPVLVTMLVVDLALGCISKTIPQFNIMSAGMSVRSIVGLLVIVVGMALTGAVLTQAITKAMIVVERFCATPAQ
jgi:flagellar biosynthetic protein FliR